MYQSKVSFVSKRNTVQILRAKYGPIEIWQQAWPIMKMRKFRDEICDTFSFSRAMTTLCMYKHSNNWTLGLDLSFLVKTLEFTSSSLSLSSRTQQPASQSLFCLTRRKARSYSASPNPFIPITWYSKNHSNQNTLSNIKLHSFHSARALGSAAAGHAHNETPNFSKLSLRPALIGIQNNEHVSALEGSV